MVVLSKLSLHASLGGGGIDSAFGWWGVSTADLFHTCSVSPTYQVPSSPTYGYQLPFDGNGYAFFLNYAEPPATDLREYTQTKLTDTLVSGTKYYAAFRISFADQFRYASDGIGAFLSMDTVYGSGPGLIVDSIPQVQVPDGTPVTDSANWVLVQGSFIAKGGEQYLTIGNFKHDTSLTLQDIGGTAAIGGYYLDGVCVSPDSLTCYNFVGIHKLENEEKQINIYPNPTAGILHIDTDEKLREIKILTVTGKVVKSVLPNSNTIHTTDLPIGIYLIQITTDKQSFSEKIIKLN